MISNLLAIKHKFLSFRRPSLLILTTIKSVESRMTNSTENFATKKFILNNDIQMPCVGFGTYRIRDSNDIMRCIDYALSAGYRMFDTAAVYGNEVHLRTAFKRSLSRYGLEREDIFITTKLSPSDHGDTETVFHAFEKSLDNLGLEYVDLYLIHFPGASKMPTSDKRNKVIRETTWKSFEELYDTGRVKAIGVSNFTISHLKGLVASGQRITPAVNQVEWHPYYYQKDLLKYCKDNNILLQAYCSLGGTSSHDLRLLEEPAVKQIAEKLHVTCAQVLLVWALQQGVAVIPKSKSAERIKENISLNFKLAPEDMTALNALGKKNEKFAWDPNPVP